MQHTASRTARRGGRAREHPCRVRGEASASADSSGSAHCCWTGFLIGDSGDGYLAACSGRRACRAPHDSADCNLPARTARARAPYGAAADRSDNDIGNHGPWPGAVGDQRIPGILLRPHFGSGGYGARHCAIQRGHVHKPVRAPTATTGSRSFWRAGGTITHSVSGLRHREARRKAESGRQACPAARNSRPRGLSCRPRTD